MQGESSPVQVKDPYRNLHDYCVGFHPANLECIYYTPSVSPSGVKAKWKKERKLLNW